MSWLDEGLKFLQDAFAPAIAENGGKKFSNKTFTEIKPAPDPLFGQFDVSTLTAFRDLIACNAENIAASKTPLIHILNHADVRMEVGGSDEHGRRQVFAKATPVPYKGFVFDKYHSVEDFIVGIQAHFALSTDRDYLLSVSSKITAQGMCISEDDGISQQVTVNASLALKGTEKLKSRVTLCPYRTFSEVDQPASEFVLRARKQEGEPPELALFEADGGKWKIAAVQNIAFYLRSLEIKLPIIA